MKPHWLLIPVIFLSGAGHSFADEYIYTVARLEQPDCKWQEYRSQKSPSGESKKIEITILKLQAVLQAKGDISRDDKKMIDACAHAAINDQIGLPVAWNDPAGASRMFKKLVKRCLEVRAPSISVETAFLQTEKKCRRQDAK